jgi:transposase
MAIPEERRKTVRMLFDEGKRKKEIARLLDLSPKTVRRIIDTEDEEYKPEKSKQAVDVKLLEELYRFCGGYASRMREVLKDKHEIEIQYSTLTRLLRKNNIGQKIGKRVHHFGDVIGAEMQHDTTGYRLTIDGKLRKVVCSGLYMRYSKMRYIKFYIGFNRFNMKCFFYEALMYWKHSAAACVIDNTSLAVLHGTGSRAEFSGEMKRFAKPYGFSWIAHEKGHANRKAGIERVFRTVETNFLTGREFESMEDLNKQAFEWATERYARRPLSKTKVIPAVLFEEEKPYLIKLTSYIEPPYRPHERKIDQYGYVAFGGNYYWIPGKSTGRVSVVEYPDRLRIYPEDEKHIEYPLPAEDTRNAKFTPAGVDTNPYKPRNLKQNSREEEKRLRASGQSCSEYIDFINSGESGVRYRFKFIRELYELMTNMAPSLWNATIERALKYRVSDLEAIARISRQLMGGKKSAELPYVNDSYREREAYLKGQFSQEADLDYYGELMEGEKSDDG